MKTFLKACMLILLLTNTLFSKAQKAVLHPELFSKVEKKISYPKADLEKIFTASKGNKFRVSLPGNFNFSGTIVSSVQRYANLKSFLIKSDVLNGAMFSVSRSINADNSISYKGRIISPDYADGFELKMDAAGNYFLNKINMDELIQDR